MRKRTKDYSISMFGMPKDLVEAEALGVIIRTNANTFKEVLSGYKNAWQKQKEILELLESAQSTLVKFKSVMYSTKETWNWYLERVEHLDNCIVVAKSQVEELEHAWKLIADGYIPNMSDALEDIDDYIDDLP